VAYDVSIFHKRRRICSRKHLVDIINDKILMYHAWTILVLAKENGQLALL
jgi:hypothetical protein